MILIPACTITLQGAAGEDANQSGDLDLATALTLQGAGPTRTILDGGASDRVLHILPGTLVGLSGLTVRNGKAEFGGGLSSGGTLDLTHVEVTGNEATGGGGGLVLQGPATLSHVEPRHRGGECRRRRRRHLSERQREPRERHSQW